MLGSYGVLGNDAELGLRCAMFYLAQEESDLVGSLQSLTLEDWVAAAIVLVVSFIASRIIRQVIVRAGTRRDARPNGIEILARFAAYAVFIGGVLFAISALGINLGPVLGLVGIFGLAIALAVQDIFSNFIAGIILLLRRPFRVGDEVGVGDHEGVVEDINLRVTIVRGPDGVAVLVPNADVLANAIINYTQRPVRRTTIGVGVAYGVDLVEARRALEASTASVEGVADDPAPSAFAHEFGDSSINFAVNFWHAAGVADEWAVRHEVAVAVKAGLDEAGIEIPFPQRVIHTAPE